MTDVSEDEVSDWEEEEEESGAEAAERSRRRRTKKSSKYRGVTWSKRDNKWQAQVWLNGKHHHLGLFASEEAAARAVDAFVRKHGLAEKRGLNFPTKAEVKQGIRWAVKHGRGRSKFIGVCWDKDNGQWVAQIRINGKRKHIGLYDTPEEAALAFDARAAEVGGRRLNFPDGSDAEQQDEQGAAEEEEEEEADPHQGQAAEEPPPAPAAAAASSLSANARGKQRATGKKRRRSGSSSKGKGKQRKAFLTSSEGESEFDADATESEWEAAPSSDEEEHEPFDGSYGGGPSHHHHHHGASSSSSSSSGGGASSSATGPPAARAPHRGVDVRGVHLDQRPRHGRVRGVRALALPGVHREQQARGPRVRRVQAAPVRPPRPPPPPGRALSHCPLSCFALGEPRRRKCHG